VPFPTKTLGLIRFGEWAYFFGFDRCQMSAYFSPFAGGKKWGVLASSGIVILLGV
jgi:hypothetical protein